MYIVCLIVLLFCLLFNFNSQNVILRVSDPEYAPQVFEALDNNHDETVNYSEADICVYVYIYIYIERERGI